MWSIHPCYLDGRGLVALWRESLLAQKVLMGETEGFKNHPQLKRFRSDHQGAISKYLIEVWKESKKRGYRFDRTKIRGAVLRGNIPVTHGQLVFEFHLLCHKLKTRDISRYQQLLSVREILCHPLFEVVEGEVEDWEKSVKSSLFFE